MAEFNYQDSRALAERLIKRFGGDGDFTKKGNDSGFDSDGNPAPIEADKVYSGLITPKIDAKTEEIDGSLVKTGDAFVYFHSDEKPETGSITVINGEVWRLTRVASELTSLDGVNVYRKLQLRR